MKLLSSPSSDPKRKQVTQITFCSVEEVSKDGSFSSVLLAFRYSTAAAARTIFRVSSSLTERCEQDVWLHEEEEEEEEEIMDILGWFIRQP